VCPSRRGDVVLRDGFGRALQIVGLALMPFAIWEGTRDGGSFGNEILLGFVGFLLIVVGRGLRGGGPQK
jgi:hypothetical protein